MWLQPVTCACGCQAILDAAPRIESVHTLEPSKLLVLRADYGAESNGKKSNGDRFRDFLQLVPDFEKR